MTLHLVRFEDVPAQPWRNGGGVTRELLAWPRADDWALRVSVADITRDGPFSAFPGVERWFAVLTGEGVRLGAPSVDVVVDGDALRFDGADAPACSLRGGPTRDLNLMLRADRVRGAMARVDGALVWPDVGGAPLLRGVFSRDGCAVSAGGRAVTLPPMSLAWSEGDEPWRGESPRAASTWALACGPRG
ncbi:MAG: HutD family protein [Polyangiales bacterium]